MKRLRTIIALGSGGLCQTTEWQAIYAAIDGVILAMDWPEGTGRFVIHPKGFEIRTTPNGKKKKRPLRNSVSAIRMQFRARMRQAGWKCEHPLDMTSAFEWLRSNTTSPILSYPGLAPVTGLREQVGDFDFWVETPSKTRAVIEWETGNISSSHRSLNKMCIGLLGGTFEIGVLILPSRNFYKHLTDRIGNFQELEPYLAFWNQVGRLIQKGMLVVVEVEQDALDESVPFIVGGDDGRHAEGMARYLAD